MFFKISEYAISVVTFWLNTFEFPDSEHNYYTKKRLAAIKNMVCNKDDDFYVVCNKTYSSESHTWYLFIVLRRP